MIIPIKPWLELAEQPGIHGSYERLVGSGSGVVLSSDPDMDLFLRGGSTGLASPETEGSKRMEFYHEPIMGTEILEAMHPVEGKQIFDGTLGGGGHSELFLSHGAHVIGCDQDGNALEYACARLSGFGDRFLPVRGNFGNLDEILSSLGLDKVDGFLLDVGVSSRQLDDPERGFSFREDGPLDMRMDDRSDVSARDIVNDWSEEELVRIFREYGEERRAVRAAREIVKARAEKTIETTSELAEIVGRAIPKTGKRHPATQVFQAIRIAVNRELEMLEAALEKAVDALAEGGVLAVISFHSLEDRIVKRFMHRRAERTIDRPEWPAPKPNPDFALELPSRKAITPSKEEISRNPRARSAKLRVAIKA